LAVIRNNGIIRFFIRDNMFIRCDQAVGRNKKTRAGRNLTFFRAFLTILRNLKIRGRVVVAVLILLPAAVVRKFAENIYEGQRQN